GAFWLMHGIPKFTHSQIFMPPNGFIVQFVNSAITNTSGTYQAFLTNEVLPNIGIFAELVRLGEVVTGALLFFGFFTRYGGIIGMLLALNYLTAKGGIGHLSMWGGLDAAAFVICAVNVVLPTGRFLGIDALLRHRRPVAVRVGGPSAAGVNAEFVDEPPMTGPSAPT
ncbi:MAG: TQO small subunit DoxD, partial [Candidatus Baltobacteraceae bacterium]